MNNGIVVFKGDNMTISSLDLLEQINFFRSEVEGKSAMQHKHLLDVIRDEFEEELLPCCKCNSAGFSAECFPKAAKYKDASGKSNPMFILTTSQAKQVLARESKAVRKALIAYVEELEKDLKQWADTRQIGKMSRKELTDAIQEALIPLAIEQGSTNYSRYYAVYTNMVYDVLGIKGLKRDDLPHRYLKAIDTLEQICCDIILNSADDCVPYKQIFQLAKSACVSTAQHYRLPKLEALPA
jgi:hypothetical protein